jgi:hypothetical protein
LKFFWPQSERAPCARQVCRWASAPFSVTPCLPGSDRGQGNDDVAIKLFTAKINSILFSVEKIVPAPAGIFFLLFNSKVFPPIRAAGIIRVIIRFC